MKRDYRRVIEEVLVRQVLLCILSHPRKIHIGRQIRIKLRNPLRRGMNVHAFEYKNCERPVAAAVVLAFTADEWMLVDSIEALHIVGSVTW